MKGSNGQGKGEGEGKAGEQEGAEDGAAGAGEAGGAEIKAKRCCETRATYKDCEEREMRKVEEWEKRERYRESVPQGRANAAFTFHLEQE